VTIGFGALSKVLCTVKEHDSLDALKESISTAVSRITINDTYVGISHLLHRLELVVQERGAHIEQLL
jgi:hypothetical protein